MDATQKTTLPLLPLVLCKVPDSLRNVLRQEGIPFVDRAPGAPAGRFVVFDSRFSPRPALAPGQTGIDASRLCREFEHDPFAMLQSRELACTQWQVGPVRVQELVACIDKRAVRCRLLAALRRHIERQGGIWLRISPYPFPFRSAVNVRIDHDEDDRTDQYAPERSVVGYEEATTHFLFGTKGTAEQLQPFHGLDLGVGIRKQEATSKQPAAEQLQESIERLQRAGFDPRGLAFSPGQQFDMQVAELRGLPFQYVSSAAFAYDDLPWRAGPQGLLHVPVYPISIDDFVQSLKEALPAADTGSRLPDEVARAAAEHFRLVLQSHAASGDPVFFRAGCSGRSRHWASTLNHLLAAAMQLDQIWKTTLSRFATWWQQREQVRLTVSRHANRFVITCQKPRGGFSVGIEYWRGEHVALMQMSSSLAEFSPAALAYERRPAAPRPAAVSVRTVDAAAERSAHNAPCHAGSSASGGNSAWRRWAQQAWQRWRKAS